MPSDSSGVRAQGERSSRHARRPIIAVTARRIESAGRDLLVAERDYVEAVRGAGGRPRVVAALPRDPAADEFDGVDGLLLTGDDVDPSCYGEHPPTTSAASTPSATWPRSSWHTRPSSVPCVLGICRGCQVLNVALGGTLVQHLPDVTTQATSWPSNGESGPEVEIADDSLLRKLAGVRRLEVNRIHHQAVERPAPGLRPVAWAGDRTIEALELSGRPVLGIQWRPRTCSTTPASGAVAGGRGRPGSGHR